MTTSTTQETPDIMLTIADAIQLLQYHDQPFVIRVLFKLAREQSSFANYAAKERSEHMANVHGLGSAWAEAQEAFSQSLTASKDWFRKRHPERVPKMLAQAAKGLHRLDPRFGEVTEAVLREKPELVYIGLVELLVQHSAKKEITRHHRQFLPVRQMQIRDVQAA